MEYHGNEITKSIIQEMKKRRIEKIYSVNGRKEIFGLKLYSQNEEKRDENGAIDEWHEFAHPILDNEIYEEITKNNITIESIEVKNSSRREPLDKKLP